MPSVLTMTWSQRYPTKRWKKSDVTIRSEMCLVMAWPGSIRGFDDYYCSVHDLEYTWLWCLRCWQQLQSKRNTWWTNKSLHHSFFLLKAINQNIYILRLFSHSNQRVLQIICRESSNFTEHTHRNLFRFGLNFVRLLCYAHEMECCCPFNT